MKTCTKCNNLKEIVYFPKTGSICKECKAAHLRWLRKQPGQKEKREKYRNKNRNIINKNKRESYRRNSEYYISKNSDYYYNNIEHCKERQKNYQIDKETKNIESWLKKCLKHCKKNDKSKSLESDIDLDFLLELYNKQNGRCAISNILLTHNRDDLLAASIDRIDSKLCHTKNNVQLICSGLNRAKREYSDHKVYQMLKLFINEYNNINIKEFNNLEYPEPISNYNLLQKDKLTDKLLIQFKKDFVPPQYSDVILENDFNNIKSIKNEDYLINDTWRNYKFSNTPWIGKRIIWHYQPHLWDVRTHDKQTIKEVWGNLQSPIFKRAVKNIINGSYINYDRIIRELIFAGVGVPSQMHTGFAKTILSIFNVDNMLIYDPFAGWGSRLLASNSLNMKYLATELSDKTSNGLVKIIDKFDIKNATIINDDYKKHIPSAGLLFTSPPFGSEKYINSNEDIDHNEFLELTKHLKLRIIHINKNLLNIYVKHNPTKIIEVTTKSSASSNNNIEYLIIF